MAPTPLTASAEVSTLIEMQLIRTRTERAALAEVLGVHTNSVNRRLRNEQAWDIDELVKVARLLDVPLSVIVPDALTEVGA